jgi:hypothetical protein
MQIPSNNTPPGFDLTAYYPLQIKPLWMSSVREWYIATYGDRFFYKPPYVSFLLFIPFIHHILTPDSSWFHTFTFLELVYHLPLTLWAIPALLRNDPRVPLALLVFGLETSLTTLVCLAEMLSWEELSAKQKGVGGLGGMYGAYLAVGELILNSSFEKCSRWIWSRCKETNRLLARTKLTVA